MIAKLIVWDRDRDTALARMRKALAQYRVVGVQNNVEFLARLVTCPSFAKADLDTGLIDRENTLLFPPVSAVPELAWLLAALAEMLHEAEAERKYAGPDRESLWRTLDGWRLNGRSQRSLSLRLGEVQQSIGISQISGGWELTIADRAVFARGELGVNGQLHAQIGERRLMAAVVIAAERRHVFLEGHVYPMVRVDTLHVGGQGEEAGSGLRSPMPGKVIALLAEAGTTVERSAPLLVMEAMKMEHTITAPTKGLLKAFRCAPGDQVADGVELVDFEAAKDRGAP